MNIELEIIEGGLLRVQSPKLPVGSKITVPFEKGIREPEVGDGSWESILEGLEEFDKLDIPRRSHEEILHELHNFRGNQ